MIWSRPTNPILPLVLLILAVLALCLNAGGIESGLAAWLFATFSHMSGHGFARPPSALAAEAGFLILIGFTAILLLRRGLAFTAALILAALAGGVYLSWYLFAAKHLGFDAATPGAGLLLVLAGSALAYVRQMTAARAALTAAFADSLPPASIEKIARQPSLLTLDGETRSVTCLVCGVRGLPALAAALESDPALFTAALQKMLTPLMDQALAHGGTIDRLTADGFAAFWNAPLGDGEHALHACEAAAGMSVMAARAGEAMDSPHLAGLGIGIGIATGPVIAGAFGGQNRMGYSVSGAAVALAQRLQALSPDYGPAVIVAGATRQEAERGFAFLEVDTIAVNGAPEKLYALMGNSVVSASPKFRALTTFHGHIFQAIRKQQWSMARELIGQCRRLSGASQQMYDLQLARIGWYERNPPGENWDGAFRPPLR